MDSADAGGDLAADAKQVRLAVGAEGADVNAKDSDGKTPLYRAAEHGTRDLAEVLIAKGADVSTRGPFGLTPLQVAKWRRHTSFVALLKQHGAKE
jgi:ankyrin repeat protein